MKYKLPLCCLINPTASCHSKERSVITPAQVCIYHFNKLSEFHSREYLGYTLWGEFAFNICSQCTKEWSGPLFRRGKTRFIDSEGQDPVQYILDMETR